MMKDADKSKDRASAPDDVTYGLWLDAPCEILTEIEAAWREVTDGAGFRTGLWFARPN
jgi:hypothetical protein